MLPRPLKTQPVPHAEPSLRVAPHLFGLVLGVLITGCLPATPTPSNTADWKRPQRTNGLRDTSLGAVSEQRGERFSDPFWTSCYRDFSPEGGATNAVERLAFLCAAPKGLSSVSPLHTGFQKAEDSAERLFLKVRTDRCYRLFATADSTVRDLDVSIIAPDGRLVAADISKDPWSVVPPRGLWCPDEEGPYAIDISVGDGEGGYVLGVWGL
ncbi:MAG: hypothetical protein IPK82_11880 [Polyangiaceae bacterium]|nr:hypothetical protein [Polyangiaceae bacterium]